MTGGRQSDLQVQTLKSVEMLADRIRIESSTTDVEDVDIFADAAATLFPDDTKNSHGEAGATVIYIAALRRHPTHGDGPVQGRGTATLCALPLECRCVCC